MFCPDAFLVSPAMNDRISRSFAQRALGAIDLAIEFATLGEYGLEPLPASGRCRERSGHVSGREALAAARPRGCDRRGGRVRLRDLV
jgi:hypothetical protein